MAITLYSSWRASAPYRVRIGLALKGLDYVYAPVDLGGGEQHKAAFRARNAQRLTPVLEVGGRTLTQSLAILEWLDESHPEPPLLPRASLDRAMVRAMAEIIACDIHPLNNLRITRALQAMDVSANNQKTWINRWIADGFAALEPMVAQYGDGWAFADQPSLADCCLIPQIYSANRFAVDLSPYPAIRAVGAKAEQHPAFIASHPSRQPDAVPG